MPQPNTRLKAAIYEKGMRQNEVAAACDLTELAVSQIITGRKMPSDEEMARIAKSLGKEKKDLF